MLAQVGFNALRSLTPTKSKSGISVAESDLVHMMSPLELFAILKHCDESKDQNQVSTRIFVGPYGVV